MQPLSSFTIATLPILPTVDIKISPIFGCPFLNQLLYVSSDTYFVTLSKSGYLLFELIILVSISSYPLSDNGGFFPRLSIINSMKSLIYILSNHSYPNPPKFFLISASNSALFANCSFKERSDFAFFCKWYAVVFLFCGADIAPRCEDKIVARNVF